MLKIGCRGSRRRVKSRSCLSKKNPHSETCHGHKIYLGVPKTGQSHENMSWLLIARPSSRQHVPGIENRFERVENRSQLSKKRPGSKTRPRLLKKVLPFKNGSPLAKRGSSSLKHVLPVDDTSQGSRACPGRQKRCPSCETVSWSSITQPSSRNHVPGVENASKLSKIGPRGLRAGPRCPKLLYAENMSLACENRDSVLALKNGSKLLIALLRVEKKKLALRT